ncbi:hypothetical protein PENTCL1PPCAC_141, partial [Pristionchus entomophagus]
LNAIDDPRLHIVEMDVEVDDSVNNAVQEISKSLGFSGVDILINNAGVLISVDYSKPINRKDAEVNFKVNCVSLMVVTQASQNRGQATRSFADSQCWRRVGL